MSRKPIRQIQLSTRTYNVLDRSATYNDINTAHLLSNHDSPRCQSRTTDSRDGEELAKALEVVGITDDVRLDFDLGIDVVEISGGK